MPQTTIQHEPLSATGDPPGGRSPFARLNDLLAPVKPGRAPISLAVGEPQHPIPPFVGPVIAEHLSLFGRYPANKGDERYRNAVAAWAARRYTLPRALDSEHDILVLNGTREGLFLGCLAATRWVAPRKGNPAILIPNPFYAAYAAGAGAANCEQVYLPARRETGFLPDLDAIPQSVLERTVVFFIASPANPQGAVASRDYLAHVAKLAQRYGFVVFSDECYSEIYSGTPTAGILEVSGPDYANVVAFHSLSKRSNLPGLRVGSATGDRRFLASFLELRNVSAPQVPIPLQLAAAAAYGDETHVADNRALYDAKFDLADQIIGDRYGYVRPPGGFFLWLDVSAHGTSETVTRRLWQEAGVRVLPGSYLAREQDDGSNPGEGYLRVAMVQDKETTAEALHRIVGVLS